MKITATAIFSAALAVAAAAAEAQQPHASNLRILQRCPSPGTGITCGSDVTPVRCGKNYACEYDNACLANAAGFVNCLPVEDECPHPGSGIVCNSELDPVVCGAGCVYDNACLANAAGFVNCVPAWGTGAQPCNPTTGANCPPTTIPPPPPCNPTTTNNCNGGGRRLRGQRGGPSSP